MPSQSPLDIAKFYELLTQDQKAIFDRLKRHIDGFPTPKEIAAASDPRPDAEADFTEFYSTMLRRCVLAHDFMREVLEEQASQLTPGEVLEVCDVGCCQALLLPVIELICADLKIRFRFVGIDNKPSSLELPVFIHNLRRKKSNINFLTCDATRPFDVVGMLRARQLLPVSGFHLLLALHPDVASSNALIFHEIFRALFPVISRPDNTTKALITFYKDYEAGEFYRQLSLVSSETGSWVFPALKSDTFTPAKLVGFDPACKIVGETDFNEPFAFRAVLDVKHHAGLCEAAQRSDVLSYPSYLSYGFFAEPPGIKLKAWDNYCGRLVEAIGMLMEVVENDLSELPAFFVSNVLPVLTMRLACEVFEWVSDTVPDNFCRPFQPC
jgi:hypothetical protein